MVINGFLISIQHRMIALTIAQEVSEQSNGLVARTPFREKIELALIFPIAVGLLIYRCLSSLVEGFFENRRNKI